MGRINTARRKRMSVPALALAVLSAWPSAAQVPADPGAPTVEQDLQALFSEAGNLDDRSSAFGRILERGPAAAPALAAALGAPDADLGNRVSLLDLLGELGDARHVPRVASLARDDGTPGRVREAAFRALWRLPAHPAAAEAAHAVLDAPTSAPGLRSTALVFLSERPSPRARDYAQQYRRAPDLWLRGAALYLAAALGEPWAADELVALLAVDRVAPHLPHHALPLRGLSLVLAPDELEARVPAELRAKPDGRAAVLRSRARVARGSERVEACRELLRADSGPDRRDAVECLVEERRTDLLEPLLEGFDRGVATAVRHELRRLGQPVPPPPPRVHPGPHATFEAVARCLADSPARWHPFDDPCGASTFAPLRETAPREPENAILLLPPLLTHPNPRVRILAAKALGELGERAAPAADALAAGLRAEDENEREVFIQSLGRLGPAAAPVLDALAAGLEDPSASVRIHTVQALGDLGPAAGPAAAALAQGLADESGGVRHEVELALPKLGPAAQPATEALTALLDHPDHDVSKRAQGTLRKIEAARSR
jgi:HEAT repeat protein